jgi:hypothetical protein
MRLTARGWMWQRYDRLSWPSPRQWQGTTLMAPGLAWNVAEENYLLVAPPEGIAIALARFQEWAESGNAGFRKVWHVQGQSDGDLADAALGKGYPLRKELSPTADLLERVWGDAQERGMLVFWEVKAGNYLRRFCGDHAQAWRMALECHRKQITGGRFKMSPLDQGPSSRLWQTMSEFIYLAGLVHCCSGYQSWSCRRYPPDTAPPGG